MSGKNLFKNAYVGLTGMFGLYGASRQWRADISGDIPDIRKHERVIFSVANGFLYSTPGLNVYFMHTLYHRVMRKHDSDNVVNSNVFGNDIYRELLGVCKDTF